MIRTFQYKIDEKLYNSALKLMHILALEESQKFAKIQDFPTRKTLLCSRVILRQILSANINLKPEEVRLYYNEFGKPFLHQSYKIYFNVSHTNEELCIVISDKNIGVDIEEVRENTDFIDFALSEKEKYIINNSDSTQKHYLRTKLWTAKEAICKYTGRGAKDIRTIDMSDYLLDDKVLINQHHLSRIKTLNNNHICSLFY